MTQGAATVGVLAHGVAAVAHLALAGFLWRSGMHGQPGARTARLLLVALAATAAWATSAALDFADAGFGRGRLTALLDLARYLAWAIFLLQAIRPTDPAANRQVFRVLAVATVALVGVGLFAIARTYAPGQPDEGLLAASLLAFVVLALVLLEQLVRNQADAFRWNAKPLALALGLCLVFDVYLFAETVLFGSFDDDALAARGLVHALATPLLLVAVRRDAHWVSRIRVSRSAAFYSATLLLVGAYLLFIAAVGYYVRYFGGSWGRALQVATLFAALLMLAVVMVSGSLRARLRVQLGKHFFNYRYDYRQEWLRFTARLSTKSAPQDVGTLVVRGLADMVECPAGSLWSRGLGDDGLMQTARWNMARVDERESPASPFCDYLRASEWIVDIEEFRSHPSRYGDLVMPLWLSTRADAWLVVPLIVGDELIGFVVLARPRTAVELNWEVRDLLKTAARQAAGFMAQMQATEALLEARKFDAFNRMSAFVVHDLKNIVTQLSLMLKNAQRHRDNPEFQQDMLLTVENALDKMRQMMVQLREGEKPAAGKSMGVDLAAMLRRIAQSAAERGRTVELELVDEVATRGHEQRLERVLGHLVQNALDATPASGRVWFGLRQNVGRASITVGDTGAGMTREFVRTQLFRPFSSTKDSGMGIGSYESHQYIRELGGRIDVQSEPGRGTVVTVELPLLDQRTRSDLRDGGG